MSHNYKLVRELGRGAFGITWLGIRRSDEMVVAVKLINVTKLIDADVSRVDTSRLTAAQLSMYRQRVAADHIKNIENEIAAQRALSSYPGCYRYIACFIDAFREMRADMDSVTGQADTYFIVSEYVDGGPLASLITQQRTTGTYLPVPNMWVLIMQLLYGLKYMHDHNYAHRDIKPDNIMITRTGVIKYIDLGLMCHISCTGRAGTPTYMPLEVIEGSAPSTLEAAKSHDVWSLGIVLYELANLRYPYDLSWDSSTLSLDTFFANFAIMLRTQPIIPQVYPDVNVRALITSMLEVDVAKRRPIDAYVTVADTLVPAGVLESIDGLEMPPVATHTRGDAGYVSFSDGGSSGGSSGSIAPMDVSMGPTPMDVVSAHVPGPIGLPPADTVYVTVDGVQYPVFVWYESQYLFLEYPEDGTTPHFENYEGQTYVQTSGLTLPLFINRSGGIEPLYVEL